jgi:hypothetical protein
VPDQVDEPRWRRAAHPLGWGIPSRP